MRRAESCGVHHCLENGHAFLRGILAFIVSWIIVVSLSTLVKNSSGLRIGVVGELALSFSSKALLKSSTSKLWKSGRGLEGALATGRSITVMMGRWSA